MSASTGFYHILITFWKFYPRYCNKIIFMQTTACEGVGTSGLLYMIRAVSWKLISRLNQIHIYYFVHLKPVNLK